MADNIDQDKTNASTAVRALVICGLLVDRKVIKYICFLRTQGPSVDVGDGGEDAGCSEEHSKVADSDSGHGG